MRRGGATCSICHHKWQALYLEDIFVGLECPNCHHQTGVVEDEDEDEDEEERE